MSQSLSPTRSLALRVKALRRRHGWSASALAERMTAAGFKWDRFTVQNLESGRRQVVSLDESIALARVLDVAFVNLVLPVDECDERIRITDGDLVAHRAARDWMSGNDPLGADARVYFSEVPR